ncbi:hypothetical protein HSBAA_24350 [Vreelandella sulfidaeris]|uniref:Uncharacterized protein n=1 Tax=Vreelandella sulfidaeris TaxID=115553 RepID=A0A455U8Q7_9GAMM|nr:hypothetical protein HSBAA_24350 [Halomonas sulfidaeris]
MTGKSSSAIPQYSQITFRVSADHFGKRFPPITQSDLDFIGAIDDMVVGQYVPVLADNNTRAQAGEHALMGGGIIPPGY